jgi:hypothetical protein
MLRKYVYKLLPNVRNQHIYRLYHHEYNSELGLSDIYYTFIPKLIYLPSILSIASILEFILVYFLFW